MCRGGREAEALVEACIARGDVGAGKHLLFHHVKHLPPSPSNELGTLLIRLSALCASPKHALSVFQSLPKPNIFAWRAILSALSKLGRTHHALHLFFHMPPSISPDSCIYVAILPASSNPWHVHLIESHVVESGFDLHLIVCNSLVHMYADYGCLDSARHVFDRVATRSVVTWSAMISGYARHGYGDEALQLFHHMHFQCMEVNQVTFICVLKACSTLHEGKVLHVLIISRGMESHNFVMNSLIDMYAKCGSFSSACSVFDRSLSRNVVTWTAMIGGCVQHGQFREALKYFAQMLEEGVEPNEVTFISILKACSMLADLDTGKLICCFVVENGISLLGPLGNTFIDMYGKCGSLKDAFDIFDGLPKRDVVTWSAMMAAYSHHGCDEDALHLFQQMQQAGMRPDKIILACTLKACSTIAALEQGRLIHALLVEESLALDSKHLIDLYVKCGSLEDACRVFDRSQQLHSLATWNTIILGCSESCKFDLAKDYLGAMQQQGIKPNSTTLSCLLFMCSHMGLVDEGFNFFEVMSNDYLDSPKLDHFVSLVHLLGSTGHMDEAKCLLATMPLGPGPVGWRSLLSQCKAHSQVELGQQCFEHVASGDQREAAGYVLMSNIYVRPGIEEAADESEELRKYVNAWKKPAKACIEVFGEVHSFCVKDECHPQMDGIYAKLRNLGVRMAEAGYMHGW